MNTIRSFFLSLLGLFSFGALSVTSTSAATQVALQMPTATFSQTSLFNFSVARTTDGIFDDNLGWAIQGAITDQTAVWETTQDIGFVQGTLLTFKLYQNANFFSSTETLGHFRISVTTDNRNDFADGLSTGGDVTANWQILEPLSYMANNGTVLTKLGDNSLLAGGTAPATDLYTVTAQTLLTGITGFRLELLTDPSLPFNGPGREPSNGNFVLTEFTVDASVVPEPATATILLVALAAGIRRRPAH